MPANVSRIEVLGPGCARCHETYRVVRGVVDQAQLQCLVEENGSVDRLVELGVLRTPAVALDGRVVLSGRVPGPEEVRRLLGVA
jgi:small redox-active disulfide protein 2